MGNDIYANRGYSLQDNTWHQVVSTYEGDIRTMYIDGIQAVSDNPADHNVQTSENFMIGKTNMNPDVTEFVGAMDEVKVYNYAITSTDVAQSYVSIRGGDLCVVNLNYDYNNSCEVDLEDYAAFMTEWPDCGLYPTCVNIVE